jgi:hypothetical protein
MSLIAHPVSQPSSDLSPYWTPINEEKLKKLYLHQVYIICECCIIMLVLYRHLICVILISTDLLAVRCCYLFHLLVTQSFVFVMYVYLSLSYL